MELVIGWIILAFVTSYAAGTRGRGTGNWFVAALFLGPIALLVLLVVPADDQALLDRQLKTGNLRKCPRCAEAVKAEAQACRFCGHELPPLEPKSRAWF